MAKTPNDLAKDVLVELREIGNDQPVPAADSKQIRDIYSQVLKELRVQGLAYWTEDAIPEEAYRPTVRLVAAEHPQAQVKGYSSGDARVRLRILARQAASGEPAQVQYF